MNILFWSLSLNNKTFTRVDAEVKSISFFIKAFALKLLKTVFFKILFPSVFWRNVINKNMSRIIWLKKCFIRMLSLFCPFICFVQVPSGGEWMFVENHKVTLCPHPPRPHVRAPGLVLGGIWLAQDSVSSLHSLTSHTQSSHRVSPQLSLCWPLIGRPPPTLASDWSLVSPGLDSGPSLHWSLAARCTAGHPGNFYLHQKCFNSSNKLHSKLVLIRICPVMPFERVTLIWFVPATQLLLDLYLLNIT